MKNYLAMFICLSLVCALGPPATYQLSAQGRQSAQSERVDSDKQSSQYRTEVGNDPIAEYWSEFAEARRTATHFAFTVAGDHENAGIYTDGGGPYLGVDAIHTVFKEGDFDLPIPPGAHGAQTLYAPTTRPPNGSCLEVGTAYTTVRGQRTAVRLYVYDFCSSPARFIKALAVNNQFVQAYARESIDGVSFYRIRIQPSDRALDAHTIWQAKIYNYKTGDWYTIASARGYVRNDYAGWSIFETWYQKGQCSKTLKSIRALRIAYYNANTEKWEPIDNKMLPLRNSIRFGGNCFMDQDNQNLASYKVNQLNDLHGWEIIGTGH